MAGQYELTWQYAQSRFETIADVGYDLILNLQPGEDYYGKCTVTFTVKDASRNLWIDTQAQEIRSLIINGEEKQIERETGDLQLKGVVEGQNVAVIEFSSNYANTGLGLHSFIDQEDGEQYLYTQYESFYANRAFPCFDQPDLKAQIKLTVKAPSKWIVIANELATSVTDFNESSEWVYSLGTDQPQKLHEFQLTPKISTYLYALCAGPYSEFRNDTNEVGVPLGLYCRKTLAQYLNPERYFDWTVKGLKFYNEFFDFPYPFSKYDQIFVPEFHYGAMENVGCVTYRDQYVFKDTPSQVQLRKVCDTWLHEMAHMWFGNLVTMKWWEDLWLNESFASFMSRISTYETQRDKYPQVWLDFLGSKGWGYATDQLSTTHPISTQVNNTAETETNFDGISYSKGSSVLKQLYFLIGNEAFRGAIRKYMKKFAFDNTVFDDFIGAIADEAQNIDIGITWQQWADMWVKTAGLNQLEAKAVERDGKLEQLSILQSACLPEHPTLRLHKIIYQIFDENYNTVKREEVFVQPQEETVIPGLVDLNAPHVVILNVEDHGYCKVILDQKSIQNLKTGLKHINEALTRQLIWRSLWDMVRDAKLSGVEFVEFVINSLGEEVDASIANYVLDIGSVALFRYIPNCPQKEELAKQVLRIIISKVQSSTDPEEAMIYQKKVLSFVYHLDDINTAVEWLSQGTGLANFELTQGDRWTIIKKLCVHDQARGQQLLEEELKRDSSDVGKLAQSYCEAAFPNLENKHAKFQIYLTEGEKLSRYNREASMSGFNQSRQSELLAPFAEQYFASVLQILQTKNKDYGKDFCSYLIPNYIEEEHVIEGIQQILPQIPESRFDIVRMYREEIDMLARLRNGKALSRQYLATKL